MNTNRRDEEAVAWMARKLSGAMSTEEQQAFEDWLALDEDNQRAFDEYQRAAGALDHAGADLLEKSFERELGDLAASHDETTQPWRAIAAACLMLFAVSVVAGAAWFSPPSKQVYVTAHSERAQHHLEDGSMVHLNANSTLDITYSKNERLAAMGNGEALFTVERNPNRPFIVATRHGDVVVTGTVFNVRTLAAGTIISVVSGAVDVAPDMGPRITLLAGQKLHINPQGRSGDVMAFDPNHALAWRNGKARFQNQPLTHVLDELNRYFERPITLNDPSLGALPVTGEFDIDDQQTVVNALSIAFSLEQQQETSRVILKRTGE